MKNYTLKNQIKTILWLINILTILLLIYSIVNYSFLEQEVTQAIQLGGLIALIFIVIILEGAPVFIGSSVAVAALLATKANPWPILTIFLLSAIIGNILYYYLGYFLGKKTFSYFSKKDIVKNIALFQKHGFKAMFIMAITPLPYLPTIAGVFKMSFFDMSF